MKKLILIALLMYGVSCANPEDHATGNPDSSSFNTSGNEKNLNTATDDIGNQSNVNNNDTSSSPATSQQNSDSRTNGTNRSYTPGTDTTNKKSNK